MAYKDMPVAESGFLGLDAGRAGMMIEAPPIQALAAPRKSGRLIVLMEGLSWPCGLESGRFTAVNLPCTEDELRHQLRNMLLVDTDERAVVSLWATDGFGPMPASDCGVRLTVVRTKSADDLDGVARLARRVAAGRHRPAFAAQLSSADEIEPLINQLAWLIQPLGQTPGGGQSIAQRRSQ